jgi:hypothetical protein
MALTVATIRQQEEQDMKGWETNRDLFLDKEENVVEAGDPEAAFLLAREGRMIPQELMDRYDVKKTKPNRRKPKAEKEAEEKPKAEEKGKDKSVEKKADK